MSSQLSLFGETEIFMVPSELVVQALPLVAATIDVADPDGALSGLQSVHVCISSLKRAASRFDPSIDDWRPFAVASMKRELRRAIERGQTLHEVEILAEKVFSANDSASQEGGS